MSMRRHQPFAVPRQLQILEGTALDAEGVPPAVGRDGCAAVPTVDAVSKNQWTVEDLEGT
jgi:hypothetical protein